MNSSEFLENLAIAVAPTLASTVLAKAIARFTFVHFEPDTVFLFAWITFLAATIVVFIRRSDRSTKLRMDLLFRMDYQGPFIHQIREDEREKTLYQESILRKLRDLAALNARFGDDGLTSYYIGCLAFCAGEKRADVPWKIFRDRLAEYFSGAILNGKIAQHVINDHYKGMWDDLIAAAQRADAVSKRLASRPVTGNLY